MALHDIQAIFFDIGSTLRVTDKDPAFIAEGRRKLAELAKSREDPEVFYQKLKTRYDAYREVSKTALLDYPEIELWQQIVLPDVDGEYVAAHAQAFTTLWRDSTNGKRLTRFDTVDTIRELYRRGYTLGIIANTITEAEITDWMIEEGISHCFTTTILSSKVRLRKPDPAIYHLACRCIGTPEANCAYVGDNPVRDVEGTQAAGFGMMIRIDEPDTLNNEKATGKEFTPDHVILKLSDLLDIFPARG